MGACHLCECEPLEKVLLLPVLPGTGRFLSVRLPMVGMFLLKFKLNS